MTIRAGKYDAQIVRTRLVIRKKRRGDIYLRVGVMNEYKILKGVHKGASIYIMNYSGEGK
jgi:hypothetical protein